jgi:hypothetical protein
MASNPNNPTIVATLGLTTKGAQQSLQQGLQQITNQAKAHQSQFSKLFALEPLGERRGQHALSRLAEGLSNVGQQGTDALTAVTAFGRSLSLGLGIGTLIATVGVLAQRFVEAQEEAIKLDESIHKIGITANQSGEFQTAGQIQSDLTEAGGKRQEVTKEMRDIIARQQMSGGGIKGFLGGLFGYAITNPMQALLHGHTTTAGYYKELGQAKGETDKPTEQQLTKLAEKNREIASIEELRFRVGEKASKLKEEEIKHNEKLGELAALTAATGKQNLDLTDEENRRHEEANKQIEITQAGIDRENESRLKGAQISTKMATSQKEIANLQLQGLTHQKQSELSARASVGIAGERLSLAENELEAARKEVEASQELGREEKQRAQERLERAKAGVEQAKGGIVGAAGGAAESEEQRILQGGEFENMSPQEKMRTYQQRTKQVEGLRKYFARKHLNPNLINTPQYGEADFDILAPFRSARTSEMAQQVQEAQQRENAGKQTEEQNKKREQYRSGLLERYAKGHNMTGVNSGLAVQQQEQLERFMNAEGSQNFGMMPKAGGEFRADKYGEWIPAREDRGGPDKSYTPTPAEEYKYPKPKPTELPSPPQASAGGNTGPITMAQMDLLLQKYIG